MRLLAYARVSSEGQAQRDTIEKQVYDLKEFCRRTYDQELTDDKVFRELAVSGATDFDERPAMLKLIDHMESHESAGGFLIYRMDRFARAAVIQEKFILDFMDRFPDKKIISVTEGEITGDDPTRVLMRQIIASISQYDKSMLKIKMRGGKMRKARSGQFCGGQIPYGYKTLGGSLIVEPEAAGVVRRIFNYSDSGESLRSIASLLNQMGIPAPKGGIWNNVTIYGILNNPIYVGQASFGGVNKKAPELAIVEGGVRKAIKRNFKKRVVPSVDETLAKILSA